MSELNKDIACAPSSDSFEKIIADIETSAVKKEICYTAGEQILAAVVAVFAFIFIETAVFNPAGYITSALFISGITALIIYLKRNGAHYNALQITAAAVMYLFSLVYTITADNMIKAVNTLFEYITASYFVYSALGSQKKVSRYLPLELMKSFFSYPFSNLFKLFGALSFSLKKTKCGPSAKRVALGLILAVPLTIVVASLLMSADSGVEKILSYVSEYFFSDNIWTVISRLIISVPAGCWIFGLIYTASHNKDMTGSADDEYEKSLDSVRKINNLVVYTAVSPVCILYAVFFISQATYFLSAFSGSLPSSYSYAEYARRGFFELFAIEIINMCIILFINLCTVKSGKNKSKALTFYTVMISFFTLVITATAMSKMIMYIRNYGLTQKRVYTSWFMLLTAIYFIMVIIKQIRPGFNMMTSAAAVFCIMFGILCFSRPDSVIAAYNLEYFSDSMTYYDLTEMSEMSDDAVCVILDAKYQSIVSSILSDDEDDFKRDTEKRLNSSFYVRTNLSDILIREKLK
ncbi:MAG: DUF4173 domain-containing protein [Oscillospiraceae bacterium]|nr:DUF4173 domain-containing protein [Oscillospiraceae bacterium]